MVCGRKSACLNAGKSWGHGAGRVYAGALFGLNELIFVGFE